MATGKVKRRDVVDFLNQNKHNGLDVGILMYTYVGDSLSIVLFQNTSRDMPTMEAKVGISKQNLESLMQNCNLYISQNTAENAILPRGASIEYQDRSALGLDFKKANKLLIPFKYSISKFNHLIIVPTLNISSLPFAAFNIKRETKIIDLMSVSTHPVFLKYLFLTKKNTQKEDMLKT